MDEILKFKEFLVSKNLSSERINLFIEKIINYHDFLNTRNKTIEEGTKNDFYDYSRKLIEEKKNEPSTFQVLASYANFTKNLLLNQLTLDALDGCEVIENFSHRLKKEFGEDFRNNIFHDVPLPELGITPKEKPYFTKLLINRFIEKVDIETSEAFLSKGLRDRYEEFRKKDRDKFLELGDIDEFLRWRFTSFVKELEQHRDNGTLYFTQKIDDEAYTYIKENKLRFEAGIRKGNIIYETKVPNQIINYLHATEKTLKAYYYCHCPWLKESIKDGTSHEIPEVFCNCSGGYYKDYWEIVLNKPVEVKLLKSVHKGDDFCQFALKIPNEFVK